MKKRKLGSGGLEVSALGPGCMEMSYAYGRLQTGMTVEPYPSDYDEVVEQLNKASSPLFISFRATLTATLLINYSKKEFNCLSLL